jgi:hypothetical protein
MEDVTQLLEAVVSRASTDKTLAALARNGLFHGSADDNAQPPFMTYEMVGAAGQENTGSDRPLTVELQFTAHCKTDTQALAAAKALRKAYHNKPLSAVDGVEFVELTSRVIDQDPDDLTWLAIVAFTIHCSEED